MPRTGARLLAALAPAALLAVDPWGWYPFGPIKWLAVSALALAGPAAVVHEGGVRVVPRPLGLALGAFLGWLVLAACFAEDRLYAWVGTPERHLGVLTWVLCGLLLLAGRSLDGRGARTVVDGLLVAGLGVGALATAEALGWEPQVFDVAARLSGPLGSPAYLGAATALLLPVALGLAWPPPRDQDAFSSAQGPQAGRSHHKNATGAGGAGPVAFSSAEGPQAGRSHHKNAWGAGGGGPDAFSSAEGPQAGRSHHKNATGAWRVRLWAARMAVVLLAVVCLGSGARAAWVGLATAGAVAAAARASSLRAAATQRPGRAALAGVAAVAAVVVVLVATPVGGRLGDLTDPDAAGGAGRVDEWRVAARVVADHPVVGVGPEGYRTAFHTEVDARYEQEHGRRQQPDRAHSAPLDLALAGGLPLVAAWLAVVAVVGRAVWRTLRAGPRWAAGVAAGLVAHVAGQLLLFPVAELEPVAWLLAGIVVATAPTPTGSDQRSWGPRGLPTVLGVLAVGAVLVGVTDVVADHRAERAVEALARGDVASAATEADAAADLRPDEVRLHLLAARAAVADQQGVQAGLQRVDDALRVSPRDPIARLQHTTLLVQRAEATQTAEHVRAARRELDARLADDPYAAALWRLDARLAAVEGDEATVDRATRRADALTPPDQRPADR